MSETQMPRLAELIDYRVELPPIWVAYPGSATFRVRVRPLGGRLQDIVREATEEVWDETMMRKKLQLNDERYLELFGRATIDDWQGLAADDLRRLIPLENPKRLRRLGAQTIPHDADSRRLLLRHSPAFRGFMERVVVDMELYNLEREEQAEKK